VKDKTRVERFKYLARTPALPLVVEGWNELIKGGRILNVVLVFWDDRALVAFRGNKPVGVLTFAHIEHLKSFDIRIGYVLPQFRRHGVYMELWNALVALAQEEKIEAIESSTAMENKAMRAAAAKMGRRERGVLLTFEVPKKSA
jgi:RimJ/RimL family protein N-acetyltransferase